MHDNKNHDNMMKSMIWMMLICCATPILLVLLFGVGGQAQGIPSWIILPLVIIAIIAHIYIMRKHGCSNKIESDQNNKSETHRN